MPHLNFYLDFTVAIFIVQENRVLFVHHRGLKKWLPVGGHIDPGEDPITAVHRETLEESGLAIEILVQEALPELPDVKVLPPPVFMDIHPIEGQHAHLGMVYFARPTKGGVTLATEEHHAIRWYSREEIEEMPAEHMPVNVKFYALEALRRYGTP